MFKGSYALRNGLIFDMGCVENYRNGKDTARDKGRLDIYVGSMNPAAFALLAVDTIPFEENGKWFMSTYHVVSKHLPLITRHRS
jgi:hypothetical protein